MDSGELSRQMYDQLGAAGLARRTTAQWDAVTVERLHELLQRDGCESILDAGCGYGRIAIPLASMGYRVVGIDITPSMLQAAQEAEANSQPPALLQHPIQWEWGDLRSMRFDPNSFDAVLCMWLTFNELLEPQEQLVTLQEFKRVVRPGGWVLIDGPPYMESETEPPMCSQQSGESRECFASVDPRKSRVGQRFIELAQAADIADYELLVDDCPGRQRYFFRFWKGREAR